MVVVNSGVIGDFFRYRGGGRKKRKGGTMIIGENFLDGGRF